MSTQKNRSQANAIPRGRYGVFCPHCSVRNRRGLTGGYATAQEWMGVKKKEASSISAGEFRRGQGSETSRRLPAIFRTRAHSHGVPARRGSQRVLQFFAQASMRTQQPQAYGPDGDSQAVRHFLRRIMQHIPQQTCLAQVARELHDGIRQKPTHLAARAALLRILLVRGDAAAHRFLVLPARLLQRRHFAVAALPQQIDGSIRSDAREPGAKIVRRFNLLAGELFEPHPRFEQRLLAYIFGVGSIAGDASRAPVQGWHIGRNHLREGVAISSPRLRQQLPARRRAAVDIKSEGYRAHFNVRDGSLSATASLLVCLME